MFLTPCTVKKKKAREVFGLRGVTVKGVLWQHTRVFSCMTYMGVQGPFINYVTQIKAVLDPLPPPPSRNRHNNPLPPVLTTSHLLPSPMNNHKSLRACIFATKVQRNRFRMRATATTLLSILLHTSSPA